MSFGENKGIWVMAGFVVVAAVALVWVLLSARPLRIVVLFDDVGSLKRDDPVIAQGITIGKVEQIKPLVRNQIGVTLRIREDHASSVTHGAEFVLRKASFFGLVGNNAIEVVPSSSPGTPFTDGETVQGRRPASASVVEAGQKWSREYWEQLKTGTRQLMEALKNSPYRREVEDALVQLRALAEEGAREAKDGLEDFRKAHQKELDEALRKLENLRDEMRRKGDAAGAGHVEKEIERVRGNPQP